MIFVIMCLVTLVMLGIALWHYMHPTRKKARAYVDCSGSVNDELLQTLLEKALELGCGEVVFFSTDLSPLYTLTPAFIAQVFQHEFEIPNRGGGTSADWMRFLPKDRDVFVLTDDSSMFGKRVLSHRAPNDISLN